MERRHFLRAAGALALFRPDSSHRARAATVGNNRAADDLARDEDFWREIQSAFTLDRNIINLNNGGVSPSPRVVQESMRRALEFSNIAPARTMWAVLEPEVETVRAKAGCGFRLRSGGDGHHAERQRSAGERPARAGTEAPATKF